MGTRADFYVGRGMYAEWLGSIGLDGYPDGISLTDKEREKILPGIEVHTHKNFPTGEHLFDSSTEEQYRQRVSQFFENRDDVSLPAMGWPWPWEDSQTTDYAYAFDDGRVWASSFGHGWFDPHEPQPDDDNHPKNAIFPNMKERMAVTFGKRSGLLVF